ncbi:hypothetical protein, partial [Salmonella sp. s54925]|uniref:hypothetical protein n=1 Tax=Salmonella sp. s54925 TaxID=3159674 RepID=UPI0039802FD8
MGIPGMKGIGGVPGERGFDGRPGPSNDNVLFLPYLADKSSDNICYSFRRYCYVPGITSGWRAWFRKVESGFLVHN